MNPKQSINPGPQIIKDLLDLNKKKGFLLLEKELTLYLKEFKRSPFLHNLLGSTLANQGRFEESLNCFNLAIKFSKDTSVYLNNMGITLLKLDRLNEAISAFKKSIDSNRLNVKAHFFLGNALRKAGKIDEAIISYDSAIELDPNHSEAILLKSLSLKNLGKFEQSIEICKKAIGARAGFGMAHRHLTSLLTYSNAADPHIVEMEYIYNNNSLDLEDRIQLAFGLGKSFEDVKEFRKAFFYLKEGNKLYRKTFKYSSADIKKSLSLLTENFTKDFFNSSKKLPKQGKKIIFVLGMPRSGTSLVEQILSSHSRVYGAGERPFLYQAINEALFSVEEVKFPRNLSLLDQDSFDNLGRIYLQLIENFGKDEGRIIIDKMPNNFQHVGVIHKALPEAKIILCEREPLDNCFSIFKQKFGTGNQYAYNLEELGEYYNSYLELIAHWESVLPKKIYRVKYEELIANQEVVSKKMIDFCDLQWEESCMSFHSTKRAVGTASAVQVKQPIYSSSVNLWKNYENELKPLIKIINKEDNH